MALVDINQLRNALESTGVQVNGGLLSQSAGAADAAVKSHLRRGMARTNFPEWPEDDGNNYVEFRNPNGYPNFALKFTPVVSINTLHFDPDGYGGTGPGTPFDSDALLTEGEDYYLQRDDGSTSSASGLVWRLRGGSTSAASIAFGDGFGWWPGGGYGGYHNVGSIALQGRRAAVWSGRPGSIRVSYRAGFAAVPEDIRMAALQIAAWTYRHAPYGGLTHGGLEVTSENHIDYSYSKAAISQEPALGTVKKLLARYKFVGV